MEVKLEIVNGSEHTFVTIDGYKLLIDKLIAAIEKAAREHDKFCEIK